MVSPKSLNFSAIDFETASAKRASVCQVGLTHVRDGRVQSTESWYVIPPTGLDDFHPVNVGIHGITADHVVRESGLDWENSLSRILANSSGLPLVAHNATFDRSVFGAACRASFLAVPEMTWLDTLALARREFPELPKHTLPIVAEYVGADLAKHHDAAADATAAALIVLAVAAREPTAGLSTLFGTEPQREKPQGLDPRFTTDRGYTRKVSELPTPNPKADPDGPLFGQYVVLTGTLEGMTRGDAMDDMAARGAQVQNSVTKKTTMLVLAEWDTVPTNYDPALGSSKERKAGEYNVKGQGIRFVGRDEFKSWLSHPAEPSARAVLRQRIEAAAQRHQNSEVTPDDVSNLQDRGVAALPVGRPQNSSGREPAPELQATSHERGSTASRSALSPQPSKLATGSSRVPSAPDTKTVPCREGAAVPQSSSPAVRETPQGQQPQPPGEDFEHLSVPAVAVNRRPQQKRRSRGGGGGRALFILGIVLTALNGVGLLVFLIPLIYGAAQQNGQLVFGSLLFLVFFTVLLGVGALLIVLGVRARRRGRLTRKESH